MDSQLIPAKLTEDIVAYLSYLQSECRYRITLHRINGIMCDHLPQLLPFCYHTCAVCRVVKSSLAAWERCIRRQNKVLVRAKLSPYIGTCFAGVSEAVFLISDIDENCVGFLCVSGYTVQRDMSMVRAGAVAAKYGLSNAEMEEAVNQLDENIPDLKKLKAQLSPLLCMLKMLFYFDGSLSKGDMFSNNRRKLYLEILEFINSHFKMPGLSLKEVCDALSISYSYASHLFSEFAGKSFSLYLRTIRIEAAKQYLMHSNLSIMLTATECGFADSNYFSNIFKKETGVSPSEFRSLYNSLGK